MCLIEAAFKSGKQNEMHWVRQKNKASFRLQAFQTGHSSQAPWETPKVNKKEWPSVQSSPYLPFLPSSSGRPFGSWVCPCSNMLEFSFSDLNPSSPRNPAACISQLFFLLAPWGSHSTRYPRRPTPTASLPKQRLVPPQGGMQHRSIFYAGFITEYPTWSPIRLHNINWSYVALTI